MAFVYGPTNSDIFNGADGVTSGDDHVYGGDGHDTIRGLGTNRATALNVRYPGSSPGHMSLRSKTNMTRSAP
jgi:hypothetical protein